jgi:hypothetical protein
MNSKDNKNYKEKEQIKYCHYAGNSIYVVRCVCFTKFGFACFLIGVFSKIKINKIKFYNILFKL